MRQNPVCLLLYFPYPYSPTDYELKQKNEH